MVYNKVIASLIVILFASACRSNQVVKQASLPTYTPYPTYTIAPTITFASPQITNTVKPVQVNLTQGELRTSADVIAAFRVGGLEAENPTPMKRSDFSLIEMNFVEATHFLIPSLGPDSGGRVFVFANPDDLRVVRNYYNKMGEASPILFSWVFVRGNILVQINGDLSSQLARSYEMVLNADLIVATPQVAVTVKPTSFDVVAAFRAAGLEIEDVRQMVITDTALAPLTLYEGTRFMIPLLTSTNQEVRSHNTIFGVDGGGRVMVFETIEDRDAIRNYYEKLNEAIPSMTSWVFIKDNVLVQINGALKEDIARTYETVLNAMPIKPTIVTPLIATEAPASTDTDLTVVQYLPLLGKIWAGVKVYYGSSAQKAYGFEILGGSENCSAMPSGRGLKVRYQDGTIEWKDRNNILMSDIYFVRADDPAIKALDWYDFKDCP